MALAAIIDSIDGLADGIKSEYVPINEGDHKGKFMLNVEGAHGYGLENVEGLKTSYSRTSADLEKANSALSGYRGLNLKPSEVADALKRLETLEKFDPKTEADKIAAVKVDGFQKQISQEFEGKLSEASARGDRYRGQVEKLIVENALQAAITKHGGIPELLTPVMSGRIKVKEDDNGNLTPIVLDEHGNNDMTIIDGRASASTIEDLVTKFKKNPTFGRAFEASGKQGSGAPPKNNGGPNGISGQTYTQAEWQEKTSRVDANERQQLFRDLHAGRITVNP